MVITFTCGELEILQFTTSSQPNIRGIISCVLYRSITYQYKAYDLWERIEEKVGHLAGRQELWETVKPLSSLDTGEVKHVKLRRGSHMADTDTEQYKWVNIS